MKSRARLCWWCNSKLSATSHAEIKTIDGYTVLVHKVCQKEAERAQKPLTAQAEGVFDRDLMESVMGGA